MTTRLLSLATIALALLTLHQYRTIDRLRADVARVQADAPGAARAVIISSIAEHQPDVRRAIVWLNDFYRSQDGLQRREGLCAGGKLDDAAVSIWIAEWYLGDRLRGKTDEETREKIQAAIVQTPEWREKHGAKP